MADGVDTAVDHVQPTAPHSQIDRTRPEPCAYELPTGNQSVLACRELGDQSIQMSRMQLTITMGVKCILDRHGAIVAAPAHGWVT